MDETSDQFGLVMGAGGVSPGLWSPGSGDEPAQCLVKHLPGHSVYALDLDVENERIALGDRAGQIRICFGWRPSTIPESSRIVTLAQAVPVLSVCFTGSNGLAASDTASRCLYWNPLEVEAVPRAVETGKDCICSLLRLDADHMASLSARGEIRFWDPPLEQCMKILEGPPPPARLALVELVHWPARNMILYPTADGALAACDLRDPAIQVFDVHQGEFQVCIVDGERLYTIGKEDGLLKTWSKPGRTGEKTRPAPTGIVAGDIRADDPDEFLLIHRTGEAAFYTLDSGGLHRIRRLPGIHFRTVRGPSTSARQDFEKHQRLTACRRLREQILEGIDTGQTEGLEKLYAEMTALGFEPVSQALRAHQAELEEDVVEEIRARQRLARIMKAQDQESLHRHATLLVATWQLAEAKEIFAGMNGRGAIAPDWLSPAMTAVAGEDWVIEASLSMPVLIEAATVLNRSFNGHWAVHLSPSAPFPEGTLTAADLVIRYEEERNELESLPVAQARSFWWCSESSVREVETVVFTPAPHQPKAGLRWVIQIRNHGVQSSFQPAVLFDAGPRRPDQCPETHNREVLAAWQRISLEDEFHQWPGALHRAVSHALRRLRTRARNAWSREVMP